MEYWNDDLKKMIFLYLIPAKRNFTITHLSIFSLSRRFYPPACKLLAGSGTGDPEPNIPVFQYSNIPIVSEAN